MPIAAVIKGELPEGMGDFYKPLDGQEKTYVLDVQTVEGFGYAFEDISGLKSALGKERSARSEAESKLKAFGDIDPNKAREAISKWDEFSQIDPNKEADKIANEKVEAMKKQLNQHHEAEIGKLTKSIDRYRNQFYDREVRATAIEAIAAEKGVPELLLPHVINYAKLRETEDGKFFVEIVDKDGNTRIGDGQGEPMTIRQLVKEMKNSPVFSRAFEGSGSSGSGTNPNGGGSGGNNPGGKKAKEMTTAEKSKFIDDYGEDAWMTKVQTEVVSR